MLASFGAGALLYSSTAGPLVARFGQPGLVAVGGIVLAAGYAVLGLMPSAWLAPPAIALIGLGYYMLHTTLQTNATQMAPEARGLAVSLFAFALFTGQSVGVALAAPIMDRYGGRPIFLATAAGRFSPSPSGSAGNSCASRPELRGHEAGVMSTGRGLR